MPKRLSEDALAIFRAYGKTGGQKGGASGGKRAAANMTTAQRRSRARKAGKRAAANMTAAERKARATKAGHASARARRKKKTATST